MPTIRIDISMLDTVKETDFSPESYEGIQNEISGIIQRRINTALDLSNGNKSKAAKLLGLPSYQTLTNWMAKHGVKNDK